MTSTMVTPEGMTAFSAVTTLSAIVSKWVASGGKSPSKWYRFDHRRVSPRYEKDLTTIIEFLVSAVGIGLRFRRTSPRFSGARATEDLVTVVTILTQRRDGVKIALTTCTAPAGSDTEMRPAVGETHAGFGSRVGGGGEGPPPLGGGDFYGGGREEATRFVRVR